MRAPFGSQAKHTHMGWGNFEGGSRQEKCPSVFHWAANSVVISWSTAGTPIPRLNILAQSYLLLAFLPRLFPTYFSLPAWEKNTPISVALQLSCLDNWTPAADIPK